MPFTILLAIFLLAHLVTPAVAQPQLQFEVDTTLIADEVLRPAPAAAGEDAEEEDAAEEDAAEEDAADEEEPVAVEAVQVFEAVIGGAVEVQAIAAPIIVDAVPLQAAEVVVEAFAAPVAAAEAAPPIAKKDILVSKGADDWKYWDTGAKQDGKWRRADFDDSKWKSGKAPLGYGDAHIATKISFGDDASSKHIVTFFRRAVEIEDPEEWKHLVGSLLADDSAAVFINSNQVFRHNLPKGQLKPNTRATRAKSGAAETTFHDFVIPEGLIKKGVNQIAVRVHQVNKTSSDLGFDFQLRRVTKEQLAKVKAQQTRLLAVEAAQQQALVAPQPVAAPQIRRSFIHVSDGQVTYIDQNGSRRTQRNDCVTQAKSYVPGANFIRVLEGDTLAKIAAQRSLTAEHLAKLNRTTTSKVFDRPDVLATRWVHQVQNGETLQTIASAYNTQTKVLRDLNPKIFKQRKEVKVGDRLSVPGEYTYHYRDSGNSYLRLARYNNNVRRRTPFNTRSQKTKREKTKRELSLADYAKEKKVEVDFLAKMNGLDEDAQLQKGQWILVEYSVEPLEGVSPEELANHFGIQVAQLLAVNGLDEGDDLEAGKRVQIPIGDRMNRSRRSSSPSGNSANEVVEVVLGQPSDDAATQDEGSDSSS